MQIEEIQALCNQSKIKWSTHCLERIQERDISRADVKRCLSDGEIIEDYPNAAKFEDDLKTRKGR